jgi:hypothetical protein
MIDLYRVREWLPAFAQRLNAPAPPQTSVEDALETSAVRQPFTID